MRKKRDVFEYEASDEESLSAIWQEYVEGLVSLQEAAERSRVVAQTTIQVVDTATSKSVREVLPDVIENEAVIATTYATEEPLQALPAIVRTDTTCEAKLLTIQNNEEPLKGYRCFLSLSDRVREDKGDFFLQPHRTSVVWGGQKVLFIFQHHSGRFGLYYDLQASNVMSSESGGGAFTTCTLVLRNKIFIPIPAQIQSSFIPEQGERKRFEVKCDLLYTDSDDIEESPAPSIVGGA